MATPASTGNFCHSRGRGCNGNPLVQPELTVLVQQLAQISARLCQLAIPFGTIPEMNVTEQVTRQHPGTAPMSRSVARGSPYQKGPDTNPVTRSVTGQLPDLAPMSRSVAPQSLPPSMYQKGCDIVPTSTLPSPFSHPSEYLNTEGPGAAQRLWERLKKLQDNEITSRQAIAKLEAENSSLRAKLDATPAKFAAAETVSSCTNMYESALDVLYEEQPPCGGPAVRGCKVVAAFQKVSEDILAEMRIREATLKKSCTQQDVMYQTMGVTGLIGHGKRVKQKFDYFGEQLARLTGSEFCAAPLKSVERAKSKTKIENCGDCTQLKDVVRGTLVFDGEEQGALGRLYSILRRLCLEAPALSEETKVSFEVVSLKDRMQSPVMGGYRDILCVLSMNGYLCELQLNLKQMLAIKNSTGHKAYEFTRLAADELLCACAKNNTIAAQLNLSVLVNALGPSDPMDPRSWLNTCEDQHKAECLHYAAFHLNSQLVTDLLVAKADVLAEDRYGRLPLELAAKIASPDSRRSKVAASDGQVILTLFEHMAALPRGSFRRLTAKGVESMLRVFDLNGGKDGNLVSPSWPEKCDGLAVQIFGRVSRSKVRALITAAGAGLCGIIKYIQGFHVPVNSAVLNAHNQIVTALDTAVLEGKPAVASMLVAQGGKFWLFGDKNNKKLQAVLTSDDCHGEWGLHADLQAAAERYAADEDSFSLTKLQALLAISSPKDIDANEVLKRATFDEGPHRGLVVLLILSKWLGGLRLPWEYLEVLSPLLEEAVIGCSNIEGSHMLKMVLTSGDIGTQAKNKALWSATSLGHRVAIDMLLDAKADPGAGGLWGITPLHNLCITGRDPNSVAALLQRRANPSAENLAGKMPLHFVSMGVGEDCASIAKLVIEAKGDINAKVVPNEAIQQSLGFGAGEPYHYELGPGKSPLHFAVQQPVPMSLPLVQVFLDCAADPNSLDINGRSPLYLAVSHENSHVIQALLDGKANPELCDNLGVSSRSLAEKQLSQKSVEKWVQYHEHSRCTMRTVLHKMCWEGSHPASASVGDDSSDMLHIQS